MSDGDDLPEMFIAEGGGLLKTYRVTATRTDDVWVMETIVSLPLVGMVVHHSPRPVGEWHVRHVYEHYSIVREE